MDDLSLSAQRWLCQSFLCISWLYNLSVIPHLIGFALSMDDMTDLSLSRMTGVPGIVMRMMTMGTQGPTRVTRVTGTALWDWWWYIYIWWWPYGHWGRSQCQWQLLCSLLWKYDTQMQEAAALMIWSLAAPQKLLGTGSGASTDTNSALLSRNGSRCDEISR